MPRKWERIIVKNLAVNMQVNFSFSAQRKSLINFPKLRPYGVTLYFSLFIFVIMMFRVFLLRVEKMVLNFLLSMVLNPTMMDDLYYCGWESFWWSKCIQIHHWFCIWQHQLIQHSKERRRFFGMLLSFMLDLIFDNKQKRPPISIIGFDLKNGPWL